MTLLDRYVLKNFLIPFIYCFIGFIAIWLVFDLSDNGPDFIAAHAPIGKVVEFYLSQVPEIIVISLPIGELLAALYALSQMSRRNEIISMLGAGRSVVRVLIPLMLFGLVLVGVTAFFNFDSAPKAEKIKKEMLKEINRGKKRELWISAHLFRNRFDHRTWYMRKLRPASNAIDDLQIMQHDKDGVILEQWHARSAQFDPERKVWHLNDVKYTAVDPDGNITKTTFQDELRISGWSETPWRIQSSAMNPDWLSVSELKDYLKYNADFTPRELAPFRTHLQYRYALPWVCLLVILIAGPMGIVYSRRGILGGVATAISLFFLLFFSSSLCIALGKGAHLSAFVAAWAPVFAFFCIGLILLWFRSTNRDLPSLKLF